MQSVEKSAATFATLVVALAILIGPAAASAQGPGPAGVEVSLLGGVHALNSNDTGVDDQVIDVPLAATAAYHVNSVWAAEADFTWVIPVEQSIDAGSGEKLDAKSPHVLAYAANLRATLPLANPDWRPYATAGAGAVTFLSDDHADRIPRVAQAETAFAVNFGAGLVYGLGGAWGLRADFRELVAFPSDDAAGLSSDGSADKIWMERATVGVAYRF